MLSFFKNLKKKKKNKASLDLNVIELTQNERLSRYLHEANKKEDSSDRVFEYFFVIGAKSSTETTNNKTSSVRPPEILYKFPNDDCQLEDLPSFCFPDQVHIQYLTMSKPKTVPKSTAFHDAMIDSKLEHIGTQHSFVTVLTTNQGPLYSFCVYVQSLLDFLPSFIDAKSYKKPSPKDIAIGKMCFCLLSFFPFYQLHFDIIQTVLAIELANFQKSRVYLEYDLAKSFWIGSEIKRRSISSRFGNQSSKKLQSLLKYHSQVLVSNPSTPQLSQQYMQSKDANNLILSVLQKAYNMSVHSSNEVCIEVASEWNDIVFDIPSTFTKLHGFWGIEILFSFVSVENILSILKTILLEYSVVFYSSNLRKLTGVIFGFLAIIHPFKWQGVLIPVLPSKMKGFLESPVPIIVGITEKLKINPNQKQNYFFIDIDSNQTRPILDLQSKSLKLPNEESLRKCLQYFSEWIRRQNGILPSARKIKYKLKPNSKSLSFSKMQTNSKNGLKKYHSMTAFNTEIKMSSKSPDTLSNLPKIISANKSFHSKMENEIEVTNTKNQNTQKEISLTDENITSEKISEEEKKKDSKKNNKKNNKKNDKKNNKKNDKNNQMIFKDNSTNSDTNNTNSDPNTSNSNPLNTSSNLINTNSETSEETNTDDGSIQNFNSSHKQKEKKTNQLRKQLSFVEFNTPSFSKNFTEIILQFEKEIQESFDSKDEEFIVPIYDYIPKEQIQIAIMKIMKIFKIYYQNLFSDFRRHTISDVSDPKDTVVVFIKESFLNSLKDTDKPFMEKYLETQQFSVYCDELLTEAVSTLSFPIESLDLEQFSPHEQNEEVKEDQIQISNDN
ncbi:suppression of tumorigenicity 5 st5 [Anaeramoeba ignava]|uniref:Suppression of tumorigenicity 5 st5 n=1 Tax=Anaeramoeba ignava TaxID=1746090 RepID=A0A9Q0LXR8_ANAIG|nr:suppression of tumorigenicity 5 st5 [Anaeramoeba ignava]